MKASYCRMVQRLIGAILLITVLSSPACSVSPERAAVAEPRQVPAQQKQDRIVRILAIGNSFSEDAVEYYLYGLAKAGGYKVVIGNLYIGGAPLSLHWKNAQEDKAAYEYRKIDVAGKKERFPATSLSKALADEPWDFISFQQASPNSGQFTTFTTPLPMLLKYVKERTHQPHVKYVWHQTWAYAQNSTHQAFVNYDKDQMKMYQAITDASRKVMAFAHFDRLIPSGTAVQNARATFIGDNLCRDGYHLNLNVGRYTASCAWYEAIFRKDVRRNPYKPEKVSDREAAAAKAAAHDAVKAPYKITDPGVFPEK